MNKQDLAETILFGIVAGLFIWGFLTGPQGWGWRAFAWLVGAQ